MLVAIGAFALLAATTSTGDRDTAFAAPGDKVKLCHYDRNLQGPNAGPHVIEIDESAVEQHLANHVKAEGFVGDDFIIENEADLARCIGDNGPEVDGTTLVITKECTGGVTGGSFDIVLSGDIEDSFTLGCDGSTDPIEVDAGASLTVSETTTGFETSFRGACDGDGSVILVEDVENTCVVSNAELTTLTILKECVGDVTSEDGPFNFELTGSINDTFSIDACDGTHEVVGINADDTGVLVETNTGFETSFRGDCDGDGSLVIIENDDNVCVVTNGSVEDGDGNGENGDNGDGNGTTVVTPTADEIPTIVISPSVEEVAGVSQEQVTAPESAVLGVQALPATGNGGLLGDSGGLPWQAVLGLAGIVLGSLGFGIMKHQTRHS
jgi:hypothetical protein